MVIWHNVVGVSQCLEPEKYIQSVGGIQSIQKMSARTSIVSGCLLLGLVTGGFHGGDGGGSQGHGFGYIGVGNTNAALRNMAKAAYIDMFISIVNKPVS